MGDLIRMPHSELHATIELFDRLGVTPHDFEVLRKASSWRQATTARVLGTDPSVWAVLELEYMAAQAGFTPGDLRALAGNDDMLAKVRGVVRGFSEIKPIPHAIDCDAVPFIPSGWSIREEDQLPGRVRGVIAWDPAKAKLYLSKNQKGGKYVVGDDLRKELANKSVLPANVLDYHLKPENQHLIPEEWKGKAVFFWGTIYRDPDDHLCVRYLYFGGDDGWSWDTCFLDYYFYSGSPAVVLES